MVRSLWCRLGETIAQRDTVSVQGHRAMLAVDGAVTHRSDGPGVWPIQVV